MLCMYVNMESSNRHIPSAKKFSALDYFALLQARCARLFEGSVFVIVSLLGQDLSISSLHLFLGNVVDVPDPELILAGLINDEATV